MSQFYFIYNKRLTDSETVVVDRGTKTLIDVSVERNEEFFE